MSHTTFIIRLLSQQENYRCCKWHEKMNLVYLSVPSYESYEIFNPFFKSGPGGTTSHSLDMKKPES